MQLCPCSALTIGLGAAGGGGGVVAAAVRGVRRTDHAPDKPAQPPPLAQVRPLERIFTRVCLRTRQFLTRP
eukprot:94200-Rhodomonas_salina.3